MTSRQNPVQSGSQFGAPAIWQMMFGWSTPQPCWTTLHSRQCWVWSKHITYPLRTNLISTTYDLSHWRISSDNTCMEMYGIYRDVFRHIHTVHTCTYVYLHRIFAPSWGNLQYVREMVNWCKLLTTMRQVPDPLNVELGAMVVGQGALPHPTWIHNIQNMPWLPMMEVFRPSLHPFISFMISNRDPNGWTANSSAFMAPSLVSS